MGMIAMLIFTYTKPLCSRVHSSKKFPVDVNLISFDRGQHPRGFQQMER
jgi:hypothetical protein